MVAPSPAPTSESDPTPVSSPAPSTAPTASPTPTPTPTPVPSPEPVSDPVSASWKDASAACAQLGGHLPRPHSTEDIAALTSLAEAQGADFVWLDAQLGNDGVWRWSDGSEVDFFLWDANQPSGTDVDGAGERRLMLWRVHFGGSSGDWAYNDCREDPAAFRPTEYRDGIAVICCFD